MNAGEQKLKPKGEDVAKAIREWAQEDIRKGPSAKGRLGQFFLSISAATIGFFVGFNKLNVASVFRWTDAASFFLLGISVIVAILMVIPKTLELAGESDLFSVYIKEIRKIRYFILFWFLSWLLGAVLGIASILIA